MIKVGDKLPTEGLKTMGANGPEDVDMNAMLSGKKVVIFSVPGAFTPTCSAKHLPGFVEKAGELKAKGVDAVACLAVNDAFVMGRMGQRSGRRRQGHHAGRRQRHLHPGAGA